MTYLTAFMSWLLDRLWGEEASNRRYAERWRARLGSSDVAELRPPRQPAEGEEVA
ncbi:MAG TPA: hypothetical protein VKD67_10675 [Acidimicrobiales bacterium]|nr:hypothetical protein [Acidimicrobiales bacterium]